MAQTWTDILNAQVAAGAAGTTALFTALRDNVEGLNAGSTGAPYLTSLWHPYDGVTEGDGNDGLFYNFSVDGAELEIITPDFEDGYEYLIMYEDASALSGTSMNLNLAVYHETSATYSSPVAVGASGVLGADVLAGRAFIQAPRRTSKTHFILHEGAEVSSTAMVTLTGSTAIQYHTTAQKLLRAKLYWSSVVNFDAGKAWLYKRRTSMI